MEKVHRLLELTISPAKHISDEAGNPVQVPRRALAAYVVDVIDGETVFATSPPHRLVADYPPGDEAALAREYAIDDDKPPTTRSLHGILDDAGIAPPQNGRSR